MSSRRVFAIALAAAGLIALHVARLDAQDGCNPRPPQLKVTFTGATYAAAPPTAPVSGFFTTGQAADILLSGIDFNNTGGSLLFNHPAHIASDGTHVAMTDTNNNRVLIWNSPPASNVAPDVVVGQPDFTSNNPGTGRGQMNWPVSVSIGGGKLFVTDTYNHRLLIWNSIPIANGAAADVVIERQILDPVYQMPEPWPWGIWSDGTKMVAGNKACRCLHVWNSVPTSDNVAPSFAVTAGGTNSFGTPRHISSNGTTLMMGDHNAVVPGKPGTGTFVWTTFPTGSASTPSFYFALSSVGLGDSFLRGTFVGSALWALGLTVYKWNSAPASDSTPPDLALAGYDYLGSEGAVTYAGGRLYVAAGHLNKILGFNALPATSSTWPDFAVGSADICTNTLDTNFLIRNPVARSNGSNLFVMSDANARLYVWRHLPNQSNAHPDLVYDLPFQPWGIDVRGNVLALGGYEKVYIWESLPLNGEMPTRMFDRTIGNVTLQMVKGVAYDGRYFYVADEMANKVYVWNGLPQAGSNPAFQLSITGPGRLSSDGVNLVVNEPNGHTIAIFDVATLNASSTPTRIGGNWTFNLAMDVLVAFGRLFVADTGFNRVQVWSSIANARAGAAADVILGSTTNPQTEGSTPEIGRNKLFWPGSVSFDGHYLWVGEFKFSGRLVRFSIPGDPTAPAFTTQPANQIASAGATATFSASASGSPMPTYQWQISTNAGVTWTDLSDAAPHSGTATATLTVTGVTTALGGARFRAIATNGLGQATSDGATLRVTTPPTVALTPTMLRFAGTNTNGTLSPITGAQAVTVSFSAATTTTWTVTADQLWVQIIGGSGTGSGTFTVNIVNPANVLGTATSATATITVTASGASNSPRSIAVDLALRQAAAHVAPFGMVDTPVQNTTGVVGSIGVTGWALDDVGVQSVKLYRDCLSFEPAANCAMVGGYNLVYMGDADVVPGARPDVETAYPTYPQAYRAGWGYLLLTNMLPHIPNALMYGGQGSVSIYVFATDVEGHRRLLGRSTGDQTPTAITLANDTAAKPFGAIDSPGQGQTVGGTMHNWGWALTPDTKTTEGGGIVVPTNGSTMWVWIDGAPVATVLSNMCRGSVGSTVPAGSYCDDDVANIFGNPTPQALYTTRTSNPTKYRNLDVGRGAIGVYTFDTTTLSNGRHSIVWGVTDSAGRVDGIGSRDFIVLNSGAKAQAPGSAVSRWSPGSFFDSRSGTTALAQDRSDLGVPAVQGRTGFDLGAPVEILAPDEAGVRYVQLAQLGRLELWLGAVDGGDLVANGTRRDLPPGSRLDLARGLFTWTPGVAYIGTYRLAFVRGGAQIAIDVTIRPVESATPGEAAIRMHLDAPSDGAVVSSAPVVQGWALDPQAAIGSGIEAVHVWAQRRDQPGAWPEFLGAATLGARRPDLVPAYGAQFGTAGFTLATTGLAPGQYDITAYAWNRRAGRWEDARTVSVTVR